MTDPTAGTMIGQYEVLSLIGQGSTGSVYRSVDTETGHTVAIKRITTLPTDDQRRAFHREAQVLSELDHPSVLRLVELIDSDEHLALVTEYAAGGSLRDALRSHGPFSASDVVAILSPIVDALGEAHRSGVLHRDVKPSNIVLRDDGTPVLADFGLALTDPGISQTTNAALGSASYLDPDLADGVLPSPSSDLYSVGVVAYELLTGSPPFSGETPLAVLRAADRADHSPLDPQVHGPLATVIERALSRKRSDRYGDAASLLSAMRAALGKPDSGGALTAPTQRPGDPQGQHHGGATAGSSTHPAGRIRQGEASTRTAQLDDGTIDQTAAFRVSTRPAALQSAEPFKEERNWRRIGAAAAGLLTIGSIVGALMIARSKNQVNATTGVVPFRVSCDSSTTAQCVDTVTRTPEGMLVQFAEDDQPTLYTVGNRSDALRVSNFFCGPAETLAVYRPSTGVVYYFKSWPLQGEQTDIRADATGIQDAQVVVGDHNDDGCGDIGLELDGSRTWFMPSAQPERLQTIERTAGDRLPPP
jgi:serine/threonine protein kinase